MDVEVFGGQVVRSTGKYYHLIGAQVRSDEPGVKLAARPGGRPRAVLVRDTRNSDYRVKLWLTPPDGASGAFPDQKQIRVRGVVLNMECRGMEGKASFLQARVTPEAMAQIFRGASTRTAVVEDGQQGRVAVDFCVETQFSRSHRGRLHGSVAGWPEWIRAVDVSIDPSPRGQGTTVRLATGHRSQAVLPGLCLLRINGHWLQGFPVGGYSGEGWRGEVIFSVPPPVEAEVREYGDGLTELGQPDEVRPPRNRAAVRAVCVYLRDHGCGDTGYAEWRDDVMQLQYRVFGMCTAYGQREYWASRRSDYVRRKQHWDGLLARYADRPAYAQKVRSWQASSKRLATAIGRADGYIERYSVTYDEQRADWEARLARCEAREAEHADAILALHPVE